ncbi:MAG: hypothetical protein LBN03_01935 [Bifidobacteriaceae bacterium]|jgi:hypothetical protein|nr:hypothetical protein [Bifidobacteriaceae bacterium]
MEEEINKKGKPLFEGTNANVFVGCVARGNDYLYPEALAKAFILRDRFHANRGWRTGSNTYDSIAHHYVTAIRNSEDPNDYYIKTFLSVVYDPDSSFDLEWELEVYETINDLTGKEIIVYKNAELPKAEMFKLVEFEDLEVKNKNESTFRIKEDVNQKDKVINPLQKFNAKGVESSPNKYAPKLNKSFSQGLLMVKILNDIKFVNMYIRIPKMFEILFKLNRIHIEDITEYYSLSDNFFPGLKIKVIKIIDTKSVINLGYKVAQRKIKGYHPDLEFFTI